MSIVYGSNNDSLQVKLKTWAINNHVNHRQLNELLAIVKHYYPELPTDSRTIKSTPRVINNIINLGHGLFYYFGINKI